MVPVVRTVVTVAQKVVVGVELQPVEGLEPRWVGTLDLKGRKLNRNLVNISAYAQVDSRSIDCGLDSISNALPLVLQAP